MRKLPVLRLLCLSTRIEILIKARKIGYKKMQNSGDNCNLESTVKRWWWEVVKMAVLCVLLDQSSVRSQVQYQCMYLYCSQISKTELKRHKVVTRFKQHRADQAHCKDEFANQVQLIIKYCRIHRYSTVYLGLKVTTMQLKNVIQIRKVYLLHSC